MPSARSTTGASRATSAARAAIGRRAAGSPGAAGTLVTGTATPVWRSISAITSRSATGRPLPTLMTVPGASGASRAAIVARDDVVDVGQVPALRAVAAQRERRPGRGGVEEAGDGHVGTLVAPVDAEVAQRDGVDAAGGVGVHEHLGGHLRDAVRAERPQRRVLGDRAVGDLAVHRAARRHDDPPVADGLEQALGDDDVVAEVVVEPGAPARLHAGPAGEVDDGVDAQEQLAQRRPWRGRRRRSRRRASAAAARRWRAPGQQVDDADRSPPGERARRTANVR